MSNKIVTKDALENKILEKINKLPHEIVSIIREFLPTTTIVWLTRKNYYKYHTAIYGLLKTTHESCMRHILRNDLHLPFLLHLRENFITWTGRNKYVYKKKTYKNFFTYIREFSSYCTATKCRNIIGALSMN